MQNPVETDPNLVSYDETDEKWTISPPLHYSIATSLPAHKQDPRGQERTGPAEEGPGDTARTEGSREWREPTTPLEWKALTARPPVCHLPFAWPSRKRKSRRPVRSTPSKNPRTQEQVINLDNTAQTPASKVVLYAELEARQAEYPTVQSGPNAGQLASTVTVNDLVTLLRAANGGNAVVVRCTDEGEKPKTPWKRRKSAPSPAADNAEPPPEAAATVAAADAMDQSQETPSPQQHPLGSPRAALPAKAISASGSSAKYTP